MQPYSRYRDIPQGNQHGTRTIFGSLQYGDRSNGRVVILDTVGNRQGDNIFIMDKDRTKGGTITGAKIGSDISWKDFPFSLNPDSGVPAAQFPFNEVSQTYIGFNRVNPSRKSQSLVTSFVELRDLPKMLRFAGRILQNPSTSKAMVYAAFGLGFDRLDTDNGVTIKRLSRAQRRAMKRAFLLPEQQGGLSAARALAAANLAWQFGWRPIIEDIIGITKLQKSIAARRRELNHLYSGRGLKTKKELFKSIQHSFGYTTIESVGAAFIDAPTQYYASNIAWVTARFRPRVQCPLPPTDFQIGAALLGLSPYGVGQAAWELLPWSWLIDWFTNVGAILDSTSNSFGADLVSLNNMRSSVRYARSPDFFQGFFPDTGGVQVTACEREKSVKQRSVGLAGLQALDVHLPLLGENQLSILGSIAMLRGNKTFPFIPNLR